MQEQCMSCEIGGTMEEVLQESTIEIKPFIDWTNISKSARMTIGTESVETTVSEKVKLKYLISEHTPIRLGFLDITFRNIHYSTAMHIRTHNAGITHEDIYIVESGREDILALRKEHKRNTLVNMTFRANLQSVINVSRARLCRKAHEDTRRLWERAVFIIKVLEPELEKVLVPNCVYRGFCPEFKPCGYSESDAFIEARQAYVNLVKGGKA